MHGTRQAPGGMDWRGGLATPRRNRFFHGKMMDVYQFELETGYAISMRRLLNRIVSGNGVVCGLNVVLCYQECESEPVAVLAGDCSTGTPCTPGAIREQYRVTFEPGCADPIDVSCRFPDVISGGEIEYGALARWVTRDCPDPPGNPCIPLANLRLDCRDDGCDIDDIDIEIRPVVFGNAILFDILSRIVEEQSGDRRRH